MPHAFFSSLRTRLMLLVFIAFVPALGLMAHNCWTGYRQEVSRVENETRRLMRLAVKDYGQVVNKADTLLSTLERVPFVQYGSAEGCRDFFAQLVNRSHIFVNIALVSPTGDVVASAVPRPGVSLADREWFRRTVESREFTMSGYIFGRMVDKPVIVFAKPILDGEGKVRFVLHTSADLRWLDEFAESADLPRGAVVSLIDGEGKILTRHPSPSAWVGRIMPETQLLMAILSGRTGFIEARGIDDVERYYAFTPLRPETSGAPYVIIGIPTAFITSSIRTAIEGLGEVGVIALAALLATWFFARTAIIRPVRGILDVTRRLADGDDTARAGPPYAMGEFGRMAMAFDGMAEAMARRAAERERAMERFRTSEEHFRRTFDQSPIGAAIVGLDHRIVRVNQALCALMGYGADELRSKTFRDITHPEDPHANGKSLDELASGRINAFSMEKRYIRKDGQTVWARVSVRLIRTNDGAPLHYLPMIEDITPQKDAQDRLIEANRMLTLHSQCNQTLVRAQDETYLLNRLCELTVELGGYPTAWVGFANGDGLVRPVAAAGRSEGWIQPFEAAELCPGGELGPMGTAIIKGHPVMIPDIHSDSTFPRCRELMREHGFHSTLALPLMAEGNVLGAIQIFADRPDAFDNDGFSLLRELSDDMAYGILSLRAREENRLARSALLDKERYYRSILTNMHEDILVIDRDYIVRDANKDRLVTLGLGKEEILGKHCHQLAHGIDVPCRVNGVDCHLRQVFATGQPSGTRHHHSLPSGARMWVDILYSPLKDESGAVLYAIEALRDVTQEVKLETQLRQAQKLEAIGTLAGGIAHDFNNILGIILGYTEIALHDIPPSSTVRDSLGNALEACRRAKELVKQILAFSRQTEQERRPLRLGLLVKEAMKLLRAALPSTIEMRFDPAIKEEEDVVLGDPTQIHQVIMNLCANASHAMRDRGGRLSFGLSALSFELHDSGRPPDLEPGPYVKLVVSDTGHGIPPDILHRIFEPYFSTKGQSEGSGLGLAVVHGIVKSHGGAISVYSEPDRGTTFIIHLPRGQSTVSSPGQVGESIPTGSETILLVDDEPRLLDAGKKMLERLGYRVIAALRSEDALDMFKARPQAFSLVITDQTMPKMTGIEMAREIRKIRADVSVLLMSGFSETVDQDPSRTPEIDAFLMKPITMAQLATVIRRLLDTRAEDHGNGGRTSAPSDGRAE